MAALAVIAVTISSISFMLVMAENLPSRITGHLFRADSRTTKAGKPPFAHIFSPPYITGSDCRSVSLLASRVSGYSVMESVWDGVSNMTPHAMAIDTHEIGNFRPSDTRNSQSIASRRDVVMLGDRNPIVTISMVPVQRVGE